MSFCDYLPSNNKTHIKSRVKKRHTKKTQSKTPQSSFLTTLVPLSHADRDSSTSNNSNTRVHNKTKFKTDKIKFDSDNYNIFFIDAKIKEQLSGKISTVPDLYADLEKVLWILEEGENPVDRVVARHRADIIRKRILDLENTFEFAYYILVTDPIISEYRKLMRDISSRPFVVTDSSLVKDQEIKKSKLVNDYLRVAQTYIEFDNYQHNVSNRLVCEVCQSIDFMLDLDDDSIYICTECHTEVLMMDDSPTFKDTDRVNMSSRYTYSRRGHFINAMKRFQGIQNTDPARIQSVVVILMEQMKLHNLTKDNVTKDHLYIFLSEQKSPTLSRYYEDLNLLYHIITDKESPNISEYFNILLELFEEQEDALNQVQPADRNNSLNVNYKLYKLLQKISYPCCKDDFYILKTDIKQQEHDYTMKLAWNLLEWEWIPTF